MLLPLAGLYVDNPALGSDGVQAIADTIPCTGVRKLDVRGAYEPTMVNCSLGTSSMLNLKGVRDTM